MAAKKTQKSVQAQGSEEPTGYAAALSELESILSQIDNPKVDVDVLTTLVARASFLVGWCQQRIAAAQLSIDEIVAQLDNDDLDSDEDDDYDDHDYDDDDDFDDDDLDDD
jgi:exodeoxyribonuclease VII small subunit